MPLEKKLTKLIPRIYKWNAEKLMLFIFIKAQQQLFPALTIDQSINNFIKFTGITFDEWDYDSMRDNYNRSQNDYYERNNCTNKINETSTKDKCGN